MEPPIGVNMLERFRSFIADAAAAAAQVSGDLDCCIALLCDLVYCSALFCDLGCCVVLIYSLD